MYKNIYLKSGKDASLRRFHPWVFSGAIAKMEKGIEEGDVVRVVDAAGEFRCEVRGGRNAAVTARQ